MRGSPRALRKRTVLEKPPALDQLAAAVPAKRADEVIETPNIIRPATLGHVEGEKFTERPRSSAPGPTPTSMMGRCGST
jgi:hypothetical protein